MDDDNKDKTIHIYKTFDLTPLLLIRGGYVTKGEEGCEGWQMISQFITDGYSYCPAQCPKCGGRMQVVRIGDFRCSECEN